MELRSCSRQECPERKIAVTLAINRKSAYRRLAVSQSKGGTSVKAIVAETTTGSDDSKGAKTDTRNDTARKTSEVYGDQCLVPDVS